MQIEQMSILIAGGGSGLGAATAVHLCGLGARVLIADWQTERGEAVAAQLDGQARFVHTDVTDEASVQQAIDGAIATFGALHSAVNCAGVGLAERLLSKRGLHSQAGFLQTIQVNLVGSFHVLRLAAAAMAGNSPNTDGERGVIVNTASIAAFDGQMGQVAYAASKGGVVGMTLPAARDLAPHGIRVMTIAPGVFDTPLLAGLPDVARTTLAQQTPFPPRLGRPNEFAALVAHIIENPMLNGAVIRLDGALRMPPR
ncbi:MAG: SDR family NAD(P)-dependent oxidoreductase [Caldilineaceae bacterium]|nr:SDR family NAD(P)-dependent oxidoreductase [Caldilineaceae bacterium]